MGATPSMAGNVTVHHESATQGPLPDVLKIDQDSFKNQLPVPPRPR
jgi:hypothetical protein